MPPFPQPPPAPTHFLTCSCSLHPQLSPSPKTSLSVSHPTATLHVPLHSLLILPLQRACPGALPSAFHGTGLALTHCFKWHLKDLLPSPRQEGVRGRKKKIKNKSVKFTDKAACPGQGGPLRNSQSVDKQRTRRTTLNATRCTKANPESKHATRFSPGTAVLPCGDSLSLLGTAPGTPG